MAPSWIWQTNLVIQARMLPKSLLLFLLITYDKRSLNLLEKHCDVSIQNPLWNPLTVVVCFSFSGNIETIAWVDNLDFTIGTSEGDIIVDILQLNGDIEICITHKTIYRRLKKQQLVWSHNRISTAYQIITSVKAHCNSKLQKGHWKCKNHVLLPTHMRHLLIRYEPRVSGFTLSRLMYVELLGSVTLTE